MLENLFPQPPNTGPPVPSALKLRWPWAKHPGNPVADNPTDIPPDAEIEEMPQKKNRENPDSQDDYVIVLKKKNPNPVWLKEHQKRLAEASKKASELTKHLKGENRVRARHNIISKILKDNA